MILRQLKLKLNAFPVLSAYKEKHVSVKKSA
jgi:hypothetical protein